MTVVCRGVRGATTVENDTIEEVLTATKELLLAVTEANNINPDDVASVIFTTTTDVVSVHPALAARKLGWLDVPLICGHEMDVPGSLKKCIRVLFHWNTSKKQQEIKHIYLKEAIRLRPDKALEELDHQPAPNGQK